MSTIDTWRVKPSHEATWGAPVSGRSRPTRPRTLRPLLGGLAGHTPALFLLLLVHALVFEPAFAASASDRSPAGQRIVVKYRTEGPQALEGCADHLTRTGGRFADLTRDGSGSLDAIQARFRLGRHHAIFRAATGEPMAKQRMKLERRWQRKRRVARGARRAPEMPDLADVYRIEVPSGENPDEVLSALAADPHVEWAQADYVLSLDSAPESFDDPFLYSEGAWGQDHADLWGLHRIGAPDAWAMSQGEGIIVAVVDTGLDPEHPDLDGQVWVNPGEDLDGDGRATEADLNGIDDDDNGFIDDLTGFDFANSVDTDLDGYYDGPDDISDADPFDDNGHGTHVAGTIAAAGNNGIGIVGVAPRATIMALKGFPASGSAHDSVLWRAVLYAAENGASVVNNSWSCGDPCPTNYLAEEVLTLVEGLGTVVVTSAGNRSDDVIFRSPENTSRVLTVGSIGVDDLLSDFSNRGWLMDIVAPGGGPNGPSNVRVARRNILSLRSSGTSSVEDSFAVEDDYLRLAGTSMSAPHVAGAVAVLRSQRPDLTPAEVRRLVRISARDMGAPGFDPKYGAGALDLLALLETALPDLEMALDRPRPADTHDPSEGPFVLRGVAAGPDVESVEISAARGLTATQFVGLPQEAIRNLPEGELVRWDVSEEPDGPIVIRVRAHLRAGPAIDEYTVVAIERNAGRPISTGELAAESPTVSQRRVVWQVDEDEDSSQQHDLASVRVPGPRRSDLLDPPVPRILVAAEDDQRDPMLDGHLLAWTTRGAADRTAGWCALGQRNARGKPGARARTRSRIAADCDEQPLTHEPGNIRGLVVGSPWIAWSRGDGVASVVEGCRVPLARPECAPEPLIDPSAGGWIPLALSDGTLILRSFGLSLGLGVCQLALSDGRPCIPEPLLLPEGIGRIEKAHLDGDLLLLEAPQTRFCTGADCDAPFQIFQQLFACRLQPGESSCDLHPVSPSLPFENWRGSSVSQRRIAWSVASPDEKPAIFFCEFNENDGSCLNQRLTGSVSSQTSPSIDRNHVVWTDFGDGPSDIKGFELPGLLAPGHVRARSGRFFQFQIVASPGSSDSVEYTIESIEGLSPEQARVKIMPLGRSGTWALVWGRMPPDASGTLRWRLRGTASGGLFSEREIEIEVAPRPARSRHRGSNAATLPNELQSPSGAFSF